MQGKSGVEWAPPAFRCDCAKRRHLLLKSREQESQLESIPPIDRHTSTAITAGLRLIYIMLLVMPRLAWASLPAFPQEILCWSEYVVRGKIEHVGPGQEDDVWKPGADTRRALVKVKVLEILGVPVSGAPNVPQAGTTVQLTVEFNSENSPRQDGITLPVPDRIIVDRPQQLAAFVRGKNFIFGVRAGDPADGPRDAEIWRPETDLWVKETLLSSDGESNEDGTFCPRSAFSQANARYSVESPEMKELVGYARDLIEAQHERIPILTTEPTVVDPQNISSAWRKAARAMLSDQAIEELLRYYRSLEGREFVFFQHRLQPILSQAQRELDLHYESYSRPRNEPPPAPSPETTELLSLALSEQVRISSGTRGLPSGPYMRPELAAVARLIAGPDLDRLRTAYQPYLSSFRRFRRSRALTEFLEAGFAAQSWCSVKVNCGVGAGPGLAISGAAGAMTFRTPLTSTTKK